MSLFEGFDLGNVERVEIDSYTVGAGGHAQWSAMTLAVYRRGSDEPESMEVEFGVDGMAAPTLARLIEVLNERLSRRRPGGPASAG